MFLGNIVWALLDRMPPLGCEPHAHCLQVLGGLAFRLGELVLRHFERGAVLPAAVSPESGSVHMGDGFQYRRSGPAKFLCLMATILSVYGIGKELFDWRAGLWSALIVACYPFLMFAARLALIESMLVAAVSVSIIASFDLNILKIDAGPLCSVCRLPQE